MAVEIAILAVPNQSFTVTLDGRRYGLTLKETKGVMMADLEIDGDVILTGTRVLAGEPLIPYKRLEVGNFMLLTDVDELPDWTQFGFSQTLIFLSASEIAEL